MGLVALYCQKGAVVALTKKQIYPKHNRAIMKKQFAIKSVQGLKEVTKSAAKVESAIVMNFLQASHSCSEVMLFNGKKPVFSL